MLKCIDRRVKLYGLDAPEMGVLGYPDFQLHPSGIGLSAVGVAASSTTAELHASKVPVEQN